VQISARGEIRIEGYLLVGGGGGGGGGANDLYVNVGAGGGGGSGGAVLLEALRIRIGEGGAITTSGGGGGGGGTLSTPGQPGDDGAYTILQADGGLRGGDLGGDGGPSGGGAILDAEGGQTNARTNGNGGGGGGGAGYVVYRTLDGEAPENALTNTSGSVSPSLWYGPVLVR
jgi:hypothetical protein